MIHRTLLCLSVLAATGMAQAQFNDKGTFHASLGVAFGGHGTEYETTTRLFGFTFTTKETDNAATFTVPIQAQYGLARIFSLGLYLEPGAYVDSSATRRNGLFLLGIEPRFYIVNKDRFAWMASLQLGTTALGIDDSENGVNSEARYGGGHVGLSTGVAFQFSDMVGLQMHLRSLATTMPLRSYEVNGTSIDTEDFDAELRTRGVMFQVSLGFRI